mgnify:CR=1 FL=1
MVEIIDANDFDPDMLDGVSRQQMELVSMPKPYRTWREKEDIPVHTGFYVEDLDEVATGDWDRTGQRGALVNLWGMEGLDDLQIHEIEPGGETSEQHHFYFEMVYVMRGSGLTQIGHGENQRRFEWDKHSCFAIPRNTPYKHVNLSGDESVKLVSHTDLPLVLDMALDEEFVFDSEFDFWNKYSQGDAYSADGELGTRRVKSLDTEEQREFLLWHSNYIPDVTRFEEIVQEDWDNFGAMKAIFITWPILNHMETEGEKIMHISHIPQGRYKTAHRHEPGANVLLSEGEGYTLLWNEQMADHGVKLRADWKPRSVVTPPGRWWHHHFNLSAEPAKQFAFHFPPIGTTNAFRTGRDGFRLSYYDEDHHTRELYQRELEARGLEFEMPDEVYEDPDHELNRLAS